jgi:serine/threonine protein kinase
MEAEEEVQKAIQQAERSKMEAEEKAQKAMEQAEEKAQKVIEQAEEKAHKAIEQAKRSKLEAEEKAHKALEAEEKAQEAVQQAAQAERSKLEAEEKAQKAMEQVEERAKKAIEQAERSKLEAEEKAKKAIEQAKKLELELHEEQHRAVADVLLDSARLAVDLHSDFRLGVGATGSTYRGTFQFPAVVQPAEVAVKVFLGAHTIDTAARQQIVTEMRLSTKAEHPNLIRIFGIVELQEYGPVLVMELAHGGSLRAVLSNRATYPDIPFGKRIQWLADIAKGVGKLHGLLPHAVIHRDLKAGNVLLSSSNLSLAVAKVADFGLAKAADTIRSQQSAAGGMAGTLAWKAPETFKGKESEKTDVFGYAVTSFEVVTRAVPWEGLMVHQILAKVNEVFDPEKPSVKKKLDNGSSVEDLYAEWLEDHPLQDRRPDLSLAEAGCPEALRALICRCWADDPEERPTFAELESWRPPTTLAISNFKRAYDEAGRIPITHATQVFGSLVTFVHTYCKVHGLISDAQQVAASAFVEKLQRDISKRHKKRALAAMVGEVGDNAELLWTSAEKFGGMGKQHEKEFCALLNAAIRSDDARLMPCTAALVRAINALCVAGRQGEARAEFPPNGCTFRGTAFSNEHRPFFVPGRKYRAPGFVATSFDEATALKFAFRNGPDLGKPAVLWEVHVDPAGEHDRARRCKHVNYVRKSFVRGEKEYLFTAYSVFTVRRVEWSDPLSTIVLDAALDNSAEEEDLPLAPWY